MKFVAQYFHAVYIATAFSWLVKADDIEFRVTYITLPDTKGNLGNTIQELIGEGIKGEFKGNVIRIKEWKILDKKTLWTNLFNPDQPRNLAKSVTVR